MSSEHPSSRTISASGHVEVADEEGGFFRNFNVDSLEGLRALCLDLEAMLVPGLSRTSKVKIREIEETIQVILARLDELGTLIQSVRTSTQSAESDIIPRLTQLAANIELLFNRIDHFQEYLDATEANIASMESTLAAAEDVWQPGLSTLLKSLISRKTRGIETTATIPPVPPIVRVSDYFKLLPAG